MKDRYRAAITTKCGNVVLTFYDPYTGNIKLQIEMHTDYAYQLARTLSLNAMQIEDEVV